MAPLTTKIIYTWQTTEDRTLCGQLLVAARTQFLNRQIAQELTDGNYYQLSDVVTQRNYTDTAGATDFGNFLVDGCARLEINPPTFTVSAL
jgi:hypothetical protein